MLICACPIPLPDSSCQVTHSISMVKSQGWAKKPQVLREKPFLRSKEEWERHVSFP